MRSTIVRAVGVGLSAVAITLLSASTAVASTAPACTGPAYPPSPAGITLSQSIVTAGSSFSFSFTGFDPASAVDVLVVAGGVLVDSTVVVDANGGGTVGVDVPEDTTATVGTIALTGLSGCEQLVLNATFGITVVLDESLEQDDDADGDGADGDGADGEDASGDTEDDALADAGSDGTDDGLADTGSSVTTTIVIGGSMLIAGGILLAGRRRASERDSNVVS